MTVYETGDGKIQNHCRCPFIGNIYYFYGEIIKLQLHNGSFVEYVTSFSFFFIVSVTVQAAVDIVVSEQWAPDATNRPTNLPVLKNLDVQCYKNHMSVKAEFSGPFPGTIFSKGNSAHESCVYVVANTRRQNYQFDIQYDKCGTRPDINGRLYENTIVIQYGSDLIEVWDEAKRLRCEWFNDYQKTQAANPPVLIDDLEEIQQEFVGDHVEVWMEIQEGQGPWASQVSGIVPLGSTLTLVVAINDVSNEFDMLVHSCVASDGTRQPLLLTDDKGCVMREKMFGSFQKMRVQDARATVITYAQFKAFKFPDALSVQMQCRVIICRHSCPEHCQKAGLQSRSDNGTSLPPTPQPLRQTMPGIDSASIPPPVGPRNIRIRRDSGDEFGVAVTFQAISRADLAFSPSNLDDVDVLAGHVGRDGVLCLPSVQFSLLFIFLCTITVMAIGIAAILTYRYYTRLASSKNCKNGIAGTSNGIMQVQRTKVHVNKLFIYAIVTYVFENSSQNHEYIFWVQI
uniref:ZP domain-containing protein n=1 Tax=Strigamia maritima TaxID=126957 RepID=T1IZS3_STRMM